MKAIIDIEINIFLYRDSIPYLIFIFKFNPYIFVLNMVIKYKLINEALRSK